MPLIFDQNTLLLFIAFLFVVNIILVFSAVRNELRMRRIFKGGEINNLEKSLIKTEKQLVSLEIFRTKSEKQLASLKEQMKDGARKIGVVHFNPFGQKSGGSQSFSVAFINERGDGVVFSSLTIRDRVSLFIKQVRSNISERGLSKEEEEAIKNAYNIYDQRN